MSNNASQANAEVDSGEVVQADLPMYFPANRVKRVATRMKKLLRTQGVHITHMEALDLSVQLLGFADWTEFCRRDLNAPLSPSDEQLSDEAFVARDDFQMEVLAEAGFAKYARLVLDVTNPTGARLGRTALAVEVLTQSAT
ncbi:glyoxalase superfamily protein [Bradyrhizobium vignae]|uniref:Uncharacterized protein n=1 Tax=Bradyrhizobium vignae TaxID=1549949 RepID=A0A2U3PUL3_9BRAD|nr:glyoxalase superfamily protein [Bradyrhizobium vignae]SPP92845.1 protein of unknown function [Bradyrhizobium vignae]